jgi:hypothetical protein
MRRATRLRSLVGPLAALSLALLAQICLAPARAATDGADMAALAEPYQKEVAPLLTRYCHACHAGDVVEADLDLSAFATLAEVRRQPRVWQKVGEMLDTDQMPPADAEQPTAAEQTQLAGWVRAYLTAEARATAGDPGQVVLRRLSNAEYTYTLRDLTGVATLDPAREFPIDGAAGEGFTNTGSGLVMSPALLSKYLEAAKRVAAHAVLLPQGLRFSTSTTRPDWTGEALGAIKGFYARFVDAEGRVPLAAYLAALHAERAALAAGERTAEQVAAAHQLNGPYLRVLWQALEGDEPSLALSHVRERWRTADQQGIDALAAEIGRWQQALWRFQPVGHMQHWQEPVDPVVARQELRYAIPAQPEGKEVRLYLVASDAGDGAEHDVVLWEQPRLVAPGREPLLLRDADRVIRQIAARREQVFGQAAKCLAIAGKLDHAPDAGALEALAREHNVSPAALAAWLGYLGLADGGETRIAGHFTTQISGLAGYDFIQGWGSADTPNLLANSSDQMVRVPGNMPPHSVAVHPTPTVQTAVGWRAPQAATLRVAGQVTHAHPECGNGVTWSLELRRGGTRQQLAGGTAQGAGTSQVGPIENVSVRRGDVIALLIGPRDGNHACDLTTIDLTLAGAGEQETWNLAADVSGSVLAGNPHADQHGNAGVWHFCTEAVDGAAGSMFPAGSILARWQSAATPAEKQSLAEQTQRLLLEGPPADAAASDAQLYRQLTSLGGPLLASTHDADRSARAAEPFEWGLDPALFGRRPDGTAIDAADVCVAAPKVLEIRLPAELAAGCEFLVTGRLEGEVGVEGSVRLELLTAPPTGEAALGPVVTAEGSAARQRVLADFAAFRRVFPAAMCYSRIVPVDEAVTLALYHREDEHLARLMLDDAERAELERLWEELHFVSHDALALVDAFEQLMEYATQDADPSKFEPFRQPIQQRAAAFRRALVDAEPRHLAAVEDFAALAYRRPLADTERKELAGLYQALRQEELSHDEALRLTLARVLTAPEFLYRVETPGPARAATPVNDWELATRLSYFLWSTAPDAELRGLAARGLLTNDQALAAQTRRMIGDARVRRLAIEFACQWLNVRDFDTLDEKSERHFPEFVGLRGAMYEETIQFFTHLFQHDRSVLEILDCDYALLNQQLAAHYEIPGVTGDEWRRVDGVRQHGRGGVLAQATVLAKQSGASRTSPILRGNWVSEALLGERLPRPPKDVPLLPQDAASEQLTMRQLVERHSSDARCRVCHDRIDAFGFSLEAYDSIGRRRATDAGLPIDATATTLDGARLEGIDGLRAYLTGQRRDAFVRQFCKKLLGYALGRAAQLSDEPLLAAMQSRLAQEDYRVLAAIEMIVQSPQFRNIRGREFAAEDSP